MSLWSAVVVSPVPAAEPYDRLLTGQVGVSVIDRPSVVARGTLPPVDWTAYIPTAVTGVVGLAGIAGHCGRPSAPEKQQPKTQDQPRSRIQRSASEHEANCQ